MTRDDLIAWLLLPWNILKAIALTAYWIIVAVVGGGDEDDEPVVPTLPAQDERRPGRDRTAEPTSATAASAEGRTPS